MRPRDLIALLSALLLISSAGVLLLGGTPADAGMGPAPVRLPRAEPVEETPRPEAAEAPFHPSVAPAAAEGDFRRSTDEARTSGCILGDIVLSASALKRIQSITVLVQELRNPLDAQGNPTKPWQKAVPVELGEGTPTFSIQDVPFSDYGYIVRAYSPGLNGSQQTVAIDARHPREDGVQLTISPGVPFSIWLRDQDQLAVPDTRVLMVPFGDPAGRARKEGISDNFGSVVFEDVLAGDYRIYVGPPTQPLIPPVDVTVQIAGTSFSGGQAISQGRTLTIPRGVPLTVLVQDTNFGYGIHGATVKLTATDRVKLMTLEASTDPAGRAVFEHLLPGKWQIDIYMEDFQRRSGQVTIAAGEPPPEQHFTLARIR
ncbi:MAG: hypothetical protein Fur0037_19800 [Planctomycetota bacterium]